MAAFTKEQTFDIIALDLFTKMINSIECNISKYSFRDEIKHHGEAVNNALQKDFKDIVELLEGVVNKFYLEHYEIRGFQPFTATDFESCLNHNLGLINNCKKLLKFIE